MVVRASIYIRERIIHLNKYNSYREIKKILFLEGVKISENSIGNICRKFKYHNKVIDNKRGFKNKKIVGKSLEYLDQLISQNREVQTIEIKSQLKSKFSIDVSEMTIYRAAKSINWIKKTTRYCQIVSRPNSIKRYLYSCFCLKTRMTFQDCIFIDECKIELEVHELKRYS